jgi:anti-sigma B factor antagonist
MPAPTGTRNARNRKVDAAPDRLPDSGYRSPLCRAASPSGYHHPVQVFSRELEDGVTVLAVDGGLDSVTTPEFLAALDRLADVGRRRVIVDCANLTYLSSAGVAALLRLHRRQAAKGADVKIAGARGLILDVLRMTRLDGVFDLHPDVERAHLALRPKDIPPA